MDVFYNFPYNANMIPSHSLSFLDKLNIVVSKKMKKNEDEFQSFPCARLVLLASTDFFVLVATRDGNLN